MYIERRSAECPPPLVQADCNQGGKGLECARTCQNLDLPCVSLACIPGCLCPPGTVGASASLLCMYVWSKFSATKKNRLMMNIFRYVTAETALHRSNAPVTITTGRMHRDKQSL